MMGVLRNEMGIGYHKKRDRKEKGEMWIRRWLWREVKEAKIIIALWKKKFVCEMKEGGKGKSCSSDGLGGTYLPGQVQGYAPFSHSVREGKKDYLALKRYFGECTVTQGKKILGCLAFNVTFVGGR